MWIIEEYSRVNSKQKKSIKRVKINSARKKKAIEILQKKLWDKKNLLKNISE